MAAEHLSRERLLQEAEKMRRVPGVVFADSPCGRVARVAGTGLEVWEIIKSYHEMNEDWTSLREAFHWLSEQRLQAALEYAGAYPDEINTILAEDAALTPETVYAKYPSLRPKSP